MTQLLHFGIIGLIFLMLSSCGSTRSTVSTSQSDQTILDTTLHQSESMIFIEGELVIEKRIVNGEVVEKKVEDEYPVITFEPAPVQIETQSQLAVLSDIHGQYDLFTALLKANGIIDGDLDWAFDDGHFVIVGDIFDRGPKTLETLWFVYNLEQQAKEAGGRVHYLMGNHEYMVLRGDLRYLHENDERTAEIMGTTYDQLFDQETLLGRWLRSKATIMKINDMVFVHGGISELFLEKYADLTLANQEYRATFDMDKETVKSSAQYSKYHNRDCPIWYRGYFEEGFSDADVDRILTKLEANHIIVGHTSQTEILRLNNGKIYAVDSSIKRGEYGEILFVNDQHFYKGRLDGSIVEF